MRLAVPVLLLLIFSVAGYGLFDTLIDDQTITVGRIIAHGALFEVLVTIFNLTIVRRLTRRAQRR